MKQILGPLTLGLSLGITPSYAETSSYKIEVIGQDLDQIHSQAAHEFIAKLELELKDPSNTLEVTDFQTRVWLKDGFYHIAYSADLSTVDDPLEADRLVAMRGTVWHGLHSESEVLTRNQSKIPAWQDLMTLAYLEHDLHYQVARSTVGTIHHEAVLATGDYKRSAK